MRYQNWRIYLIFFEIETFGQVLQLHLLCVKYLIFSRFLLRWNLLQLDLPSELKSESLGEWSKLGIFSKLAKSIISWIQIHKLGIFGYGSNHHFILVLFSDHLFPFLTYHLSPFLLLLLMDFGCRLCLMKTVTDSDYEKSCRPR